MEKREIPTVSLPSCPRRSAPLFVLRNDIFDGGSNVNDDEGRCGMGVLCPM
jgi:hypothetical protein